MTESDKDFAISLRFNILYIDFSSLSGARGNYLPQPFELPQRHIVPSRQWCSNAAKWY